LAAPASGQGKTTVVAALARYHARAGRRVRVFKCGPDFLDPMILERASGQPAYQLDLWMLGEDHCSDLLWRAAGEADLILVEGVMGLFDGKPSAADLARIFGLPVLVVIDARAMAQTFGALALGLSVYQADLPVVGFLANRVAGDSHAESLKMSLPPGLAFYGSARRDPEIELPSRHLGLVQAAELADLDARLDRAADALRGQPVTKLLPIDTVFYQPHLPQISGELAGLTLAVAKDAAFSFIYRANLDLLEALGAKAAFFSPIAGERLPRGVDAVYLPGGYPELYLKELAQNAGLKEDLLAHDQKGLPILAECGGLLYLLETLSADGADYPMAGVLPGRATMTGGLKGLGLMRLDLPEGSVRGHAFHHSQVETSLEPKGRAIRPDGRLGENWYRRGRLTASYVHLYWPSNPLAMAALFRP
jgi:cobyrinic acid a,c-diamide synthase